MGITPPLNAPQSNLFLGVQRKDAAQLETPRLPVLILGHHRLFKPNLKQMKSGVKSEQKRQKRDESFQEVVK